MPNVFYLAGVLSFFSPVLARRSFSFVFSNSSSAILFSSPSNMTPSKTSGSSCSVAILFSSPSNMAPSKTSGSSCSVAILFSSPSNMAPSKTSGSSCSVQISAPRPKGISGSGTASSVFVICLIRKIGLIEILMLSIPLTKV